MGCGDTIAFGVWECDRCLESVEDAIAVWRVWRVRSLFGEVGMRSLFGDVEVRSLLGMWECDRFWGVGVRSLLGCGGAISFGDVGYAIACGM